MNTTKPVEFISGIGRYLRLYRHFLTFSFSRSFEFRFDFYIRVIMDVIYYSVAISFFKILYSNTPVLGGWNENQAMVFVAAFCIIDALNMTFFSNNLFMFPFLINRGDLDYYLIRPVSTLFFVSLRDFAANSFLNLLITFGILIWAISNLEVTPSFFRIAVFGITLTNGVLIFYMLNMILNTLVFFSPSADGYAHMIWSLGKLGERPDRIFSGWTKRLLTTVIPFSVIASFPTRLLLDPFDWSILFHCFAVSTILASILAFAWNRALRAYSSASS